MILVADQVQSCFDHDAAKTIVAISKAVHAFSSPQTVLERYISDVCVKETTKISKENATDAHNSGNHSHSEYVGGGSTRNGCQNEQAFQRCPLWLLLAYPVL
jgi:hypothetical protein